ncbi:MAG: hypothetical protein KDC12_08305 [Flavobacteriales bacterium]|nr:hypothetical protein [Flavobacteriales bacterium]
MTRILFALCIAFSLVSCQPVLDDQTILGSWKVEKAEIKAINPNITQDAMNQTKKRMEATRYSYLEDGSLTVSRGNGEVYKGGTWMLDLNRGILTMQEKYKEMQLPSVLWKIDMSTDRTMTVTSTQEGKLTTTLHLSKVGQ